MAAVVMSVLRAGSPVEVHDSANPVLATPAQGFLQKCPPAFYEWLVCLNRDDPVANRDPNMVKSRLCDPLDIGFSNPSAPVFLHHLLTLSFAEGFAETPLPQSGLNSV